jgi:hypothetical protein
MNTIGLKAILSLAAILALTALPGCQRTQPETVTEPDRTPKSGTEIDRTPETEAPADSRLASGVKLMAAGEPIDIEVGHLVPCVTDWNSDGRKDLLVGQFRPGAIRLYLNHGTDASPVFKDFSMLHAGGKPIRLDAG